MDDALAQRIVRNYICAHCWGQLTIVADPLERNAITCPACGEFPGCVTRAYAERQKAENIHEAVEVKAMLRRVGVLPPRPRKPIKQQLDELGFKEIPCQ